MVCTTRGRLTDRRGGDPDGSQALPHGSRSDEVGVFFREGPRCGDESVEVLLGEGKAERQVTALGYVVAPGEQVVEEQAAPAGIDARDVGPPLHRSRDGVNRHHGADARHAEPDRGQRLSQLVPEPVTAVVEPFERVGVQQFRNRAPNGHREGVVVERAAVRETTLGRIKRGHHMPGAPEGPEGETTAEVLAQHRQVGVDVVHLLRPADGQPGRHHLVHDEKRAVCE